MHGRTWHSSSTTARQQRNAPERKSLHRAHVLRAQPDFFCPNCIPRHNSCAPLTARLHFSRTKITPKFHATSSAFATRRKEGLSFFPDWALPRRRRRLRMKEGWRMAACIIYLGGNRGGGRQATTSRQPTDRPSNQ